MSKTIQMNAAQAIKIINDARSTYCVSNLVRVIGRHGTSDCIKIKEKKHTEKGYDSNAMSGFHSTVRDAGLTYIGLGVGFDYNTNEYTMAYKW